MKRAFGLLVVLILVMGIGCAAAEQRVNLPDSAYSLALPDEMKYSAPGPQSTERFAYAAKKLGLEISFYRYDDNGWTLDAFSFPIRKSWSLETIFWTNISEGM